MFEYHQKVDEPSRWMLTELEEKGKSFSMVGDYRIKQMIGKGTFSKVYLGQSKETGQLAALKVIQKHSLTFDSMSLFERELQSLTRVTRHKNVLTIFDQQSSCRYGKSILFINL